VCVCVCVCVKCVRKTEPLIYTLALGVVNFIATLDLTKTRAKTWKERLHLSALMSHAITTCGSAATTRPSNVNNCAHFYNIYFIILLCRYWVAFSLGFLRCINAFDYLDCRVRCGLRILSKIHIDLIDIRMRNTHES